jgi:hypothetical protein
MRRAPITLLIAVAGLLLAGQVTVGARAPAGQGGPHTTVEFKLKANNGLSARLGGIGNRIDLTIVGHRQSVYYAVHGKVSEQGVEARFGKLGQISVTFRPTRTVDSTAPPPECTGDPWTTEKGVFEGTIRFSGERDYVKIDSAEAHGEQRATPQWKCPPNRHPAEPPPPSVESRPRAAEEGDVATLDAKLPGTQLRFRALAVRYPKRGDYTVFYGGEGESREGMQIWRIASCTARSSTFVFDHAQGTATVSPPWPFRGSASFRRDRGGSNAWTGSLSVPLLGAAPVALAGRRFDARLVRDFPGD